MAKTRHSDLTITKAIQNTQIHSRKIKKNNFNVLLLNPKGFGIFAVNLDSKSLKSVLLQING